jgi:anti-sigma regulatory factor (Ser/Thr protein kinase)
MLDMNFTTRQPLPQWAGTLPRRAAGVVAKADLAQPHLYVTMDPSPAQLGVIRAQITEWASAVGLSLDQSDDVVLAVDEAVANAIEHAFESGETGTITVFAAGDLRHDAAHVVVADTGTWQPPPADPGTRGRGLYLMNVLSDQFDLHHDRRGTTVVLRWPLA